MTTFTREDVLKVVSSRMAVRWGLPGLCDGSTFVWWNGGNTEDMCLLSEGDPLDAEEIFFFRRESSGEWACWYLARDRDRESEIHEESLRGTDLGEEDQAYQEAWEDVPTCFTSSRAVIQDVSLNPEELGPIFSLLLYGPKGPTWTYWYGTDRIEEMLPDESRYGRGLMSIDPFSGEPVRVGPDTPAWREICHRLGVRTIRGSVR